MKRFNLIAAFLVAAGFSTVFTSCEKAGGEDKSANELNGYVTSDLTLEKGQTYTLTGSLQVKAPATLTIEEGVRVVAANNGQINYILIEQGARINAVGTAENPIVLTSEAEKHGGWGGLHICGKAPVNVDGGTAMSEIGNAVYGGNAADDNSGILKYVRIEYSGYALDEEHEANGLTLYGVGNGTEISYVETYVGSDDGIEFFGGTVNVDHCIAVDCTDDSFDWTQGWTGKGEYMVAYQISDDCDCLMECDNNDKNLDATPVSHPTLNHITLVGKDTETGKRGIRLRAGTYANISNALVVGKSSSIVLETQQTIASFENSTSSFSNVIVSGSFSCASGEGITSSYDSDDFTADGNRTAQTITLTDNYVGQVDGAGAVPSDDDWTEGWTR